jgi:hypothetical protein
MNHRIGGSSAVKATSVPEVASNRKDQDEVYIFVHYYPLSNNLVFDKSAVTCW